MGTLATRITITGPSKNLVNHYYSHVRRTLRNFLGHISNKLISRIKANNYTSTVYQVEDIFMDSS